MKSILLRLFPILTLALAQLRAADEPRLTALRAADGTSLAREDTPLCIGN